MVADAYLQLRDLILRGDPHSHGWGPSSTLPDLWGALVEVGLPEGPATLVSLVDGTTSLYLGNGGATIGAGEVPPVAEATQRLLVAIQGALDAFHAVWEFPIPEPGHVRVVALTYAGAMGADAVEADLASNTHPLASVYAASGAVLDEIQRVEAAMPEGPGPELPGTVQSSGD
jgi:hypothetical protein